MSPQPTAAPAPKPERPHAAILDAIDAKLDAGDDLSSVEKQIHRANLLESERADVMKRIGANREYLRLMEENEELTDEQADWLDDFYPQKEQGKQRSEADIERTRKAKAAARKS